MKKLTLSLLYLFSFSVFGNEFTFNYKNINTLSSLICNQLKMAHGADEILVSRFNVDKTKLTPKGHSQIIEVNGTCNA